MSPTPIEINVEYCGSCGYSNKFEELLEHFKQQNSDVRVTGYTGRSGSFEVKVNDTLVHSKLATLAFPDYDDLLKIAEEAKCGQDLRTCKQQPITNCSIS